MSIHSFHLAPVPLTAAVGALLCAPTAPGLRHMEVLWSMELGAPIVSLRRLQLRRIAVFAEWEDEAALETFLTQHPFGKRLSAGWHVRLRFLRRWGAVREFADLPEVSARSERDEPIVAVTLARLRFLQLPRFIYWGRPVERQVRDHAEVTLAMAAMRMPRTVSTFSIWTSARAMTGMVFGRDSGDANYKNANNANNDTTQRHAAAMTERERRDFHHEFTTLRFRPLSEHGSWDGQTSFIPWGQ